jgi:hypothetical protein
MAHRTPRPPDPRRRRRRQVISRRARAERTEADLRHRLKLTPEDVERIACTNIEWSATLAFMRRDASRLLMLRKASRRPGRAWVRNLVAQLLESLAPLLLTRRNRARGAADLPPAGRSPNRRARRQARPDDPLSPQRLVHTLTIAANAPGGSLVVLPQT